MNAGVHVSFRDVKIKIPDRGMWMTSCTGSERGGFWEIWKSQLVELRTRHRTRRVDFRGSQRADEFAHYGHCTRCGGGGRWKSQNRKNVYLSPYVEEPLNWKVIKSFVPELRSRKCFSCFGIPTFNVYMLWTFYVRFAYPYHGYGTHCHNSQVHSDSEWSYLQLFHQQVK